jgi:hypothetical protein
VQIRFDPPDDWSDETGSTVVFRRTGDGSYAASGKGYSYEAVRADTPQGVILWDAGMRKALELACLLPPFPTTLYGA